MTTPTKQDDTPAAAPPAAKKAPAKKAAARKPAAKKATPAKKRAGGRGRFKLSGGAVAVLGDVAPGDYYVAGHMAKIRVDAAGARLVDGDLPDGTHTIGGAYADLTAAGPGVAEQTADDAGDDAGTGGGE